jgi:hypothetical protein
VYDPVDERGVPASRGTPMVVRIATIIGILCIFGIGGSVIMLAGYGHWWPDQKAMRIPLTNPGYPVIDKRIPIRIPGPPRQSHPSHPAARH